MPATRVLDIHDLLTADTVRVGLPGRTKEEVLNNLVDHLKSSPSVRDIDAVRAAIFDREEIMSTGVGKGLALPHAKSPAVRESVAAFAVTDQPVDFGSIDDQSVRLVFLLVGTEAAKSEHIKILSRVSRLMNRDPFRTSLLNAKSSEEIMSIFETGENELMER